MGPFSTYQQIQCQIPTHFAKINLILPQISLILGLFCQKFFDSRPDSAFPALLRGGNAPFFANPYDQKHQHGKKIDQWFDLPAFHDQNVMQSTHGNSWVGNLV